MRIKVQTGKDGAGIPLRAGLISVDGHRYDVIVGGHYRNGAEVPIVCIGGAPAAKPGEKLTWLSPLTGCADFAEVVPSNDLSREAQAICRDGCFGEEDIRGFLPALAVAIEQHGEVEVVKRCQIARANCATPGFAIECVLQFYRTPASARAAAEMAQRAMTTAEVAAARDALTAALMSTVRSGYASIGISVDVSRN